MRFSFICILFVGLVILECYFGTAAICLHRFVSFNILALNSANFY